MDNTLIDLLTKLSGVALSSQNKTPEKSETQSESKTENKTNSFLDHSSSFSNSQTKNSTPKSIISKKSSREAIIDMINNHNARSQRIQSPPPTNKK